jgi:hypothetical protein
MPSDFTIVTRGLHEGAAELTAIKEMQRLGDYPRPTQLVARRLSDHEAQAARSAGRLEPLFRIIETEFEAGLFQDIEAALASPGEPVDKNMGNYIIHRDFTTSDAVNRFLSGDGRAFFVQRGAAVFELALRPGG